MWCAYYHMQLFNTTVSFSLRGKRPSDFYDLNSSVSGCVHRQEAFTSPGGKQGSYTYRRKLFLELTRNNAKKRYCLSFAVASTQPCSFFEHLCPRDNGQFIGVVEIICVQGVLLPDS